MSDKPNAFNANPLPLVLVVDDDPLIRSIIRDLLEEEGFAVALASDGIQAIRMVSERFPALIILDMGLPLMDGEQVGILLHTNHGSKLPILIVSASTGVADKARRVGAVGYLRKPFDLDDLTAAVHGALQAS